VKMTMMTREVLKQCQPMEGRGGSPWKKTKPPTAMSS
jgi:hypothetical protein